MARPDAAPELEPEMRGLWVGVLVYRWASYAWMTVLAITTRDDLRRPVPALAAAAVVGVWNVWFTVTRAWGRRSARFVDLGISVFLLPFSGWVMAEGTASGGAPFFATSYPAASALTMGIGEGLAGGLAGGIALSIALALSRPANGTPLSDLTADQWALLVNGVVYHVSAGGAAGVVSKVIRRSARDRETAVEEAARERERAARLAERETLGREIHDSVLQSLAMIGKRGRELTGAGTPAPPHEVEELVELAARQERALRALLSEPADTPPAGFASLRTALQAAAYAAESIPVTVNMAGHVWLPAAEVEELAAAVRQALDNSAMHAAASRVIVFAETGDGSVVVSVRDDGVGFDYDEARLAREGKIGMLRSMKGRVEDLGGTMTVRTAPGTGTEVEFRVPEAQDGTDG